MTSRNDNTQYIVYMNEFDRDTSNRNTGMMQTSKKYGLKLMKHNIEHVSWEELSWEIEIERWAKERGDHINK